MAEAGIGVDIVEIARMERIMRDTPGFFPRMFTEEERQYCEASARPAAHYACRFAAREAVLKALGVGFGQEALGVRTSLSLVMPMVARLPSCLVGPWPLPSVLACRKWPFPFRSRVSLPLPMPWRLLLISGLKLRRSAFPNANVSRNLFARRVRFSTNWNAFKTLSC